MLTGFFMIRTPLGARDGSEVETITGICASRGSRLHRLVDLVAVDHRHQQVEDHDARQLLAAQLSRAPRRRSPPW